MILLCVVIYYAISSLYASEEMNDIVRERDKYYKAYERAKKLHDNLNTEIDKSYADEVNKLAEGVMDKDPSIELIPHYAKIKEAYENLTEKQKEFLNFGIKDVKYNLKQAIELKKYLDRAIEENNKII